MSAVLISGGNGLIGRHLSRNLEERGFSVGILSRQGSHDAKHVFKWDPERGEIDTGVIENADYVIHLAGVNIGEKRWSQKQKQLIEDSRIKTAEFLFKNISEKNPKLKAFVSASAIGYYGTSEEDTIFDESSSPGSDFLGRTCIKWEESADKFQQIGIRSVKIRSGVVLTREGGALEKMLLPVKMGIGSPIGDGKQYIPWIHIEDLCGIYIKAIEDINMSGAYNAVAPDFKTNKEFMYTLAKVWKKPFFFPNIPSFIFKMILGERSSILLKGNRISAGKIVKASYSFKFPDLAYALRNLSEEENNMALLGNFKNK